MALARFDLYRYPNVGYQKVSMKKFLTVSAAVVAVNLFSLGSVVAKENPYTGVSAAKLDSDFKGNWPKVVAGFKEQCSSMAHVNLGSYALVAKKLAKVEKVDEATTEEALKSIAKLLQPFVDLVDKSSEMFQKMEIVESPELRELGTSMNQSALDCQTARKEAEALTPMVEAFIGSEGYEKALKETAFAARIQEASKVVLRKNLKRFPTLAKDL